MSKEGAIREFIEEARKIVGDEFVLTDIEDIYPYAFDAMTAVPHAIPAAVILPGSTEEVSGVVKLANKYKVPIVPRGAGTSLTGAVVPYGNAVVIDLSRMNRVIEINIADEYVIAEAGIRLDDLNAELMKYGFYLPPDPASSSVATLGACIAEDSGGLRGARYGTFRQWVLGLEVVLPTGEVINVGSKCLKHRQGINLVQLFVGHEGLLGIITKAIMRIWPLPEKVVRILVSFPSPEDAARAVAEIKKRRIRPLIMEFLDRKTMDVVESAAGIKLPPGQAMLVIDLEGAPEAMPRYIKIVEEACKACNAVHFEWSDDPVVMEKLYYARRAAYPLSLRTRPKPDCLSEDITVPPSKLPELIKGIYELAKKYKIEHLFVFGHIGDGNVHPQFFVDLSDPEERKRAFEFFKEIMRLAISLGGVVSGEHGIGVIKKEGLVEEYRAKGSEYAIEIIKKIKSVLDPNNILNPGKVV